MSQTATIASLKNSISAISKSKPVIDVSFEYEAGGTNYYSAFSRRGFETHRHSVSLWRDADGAIKGRCDCPKSKQGYNCEHLKKALTQEISSK